MQTDSETCKLLHTSTHQPRAIACPSNGGHSKEEIHPLTASIATFLLQVSVLFLLLLPLQRFLPLVHQCGSDEKPVLHHRANDENVDDVDGEEEEQQQQRSDEGDHQRVDVRHTAVVEGGVHQRNQSIVCQLQMRNGVEKGRIDGHIVAVLVEEGHLECRLRLTAADG